MRSVMKSVGLYLFGAVFALAALSLLAAVEAVVAAAVGLRPDVVVAVQLLIPGKPSKSPKIPDSTQYGAQTVIVYVRTAAILYLLHLVGVQVLA